MLKAIHIRATFVIALGLGVSALPATAAEPCGAVVLPSGLGLSPLPGPAATFHPILMTGTLYEQQPSLMMYLPLLWYSDVNQIDWSRSIASSVTANDDDTSFRITLRPWHWSDGLPITSADILYTWNMIRELGPAFSAYGVGGVPQNIASVTAPDPQTVVVSVKNRVNPDWFRALGIGQFTPIPKHAWSRYSVAEQQSLQSTASFYDVVDGPFRLTSLQLGREAVFAPNPRFEGHQATISRFVVDFLQGTDPLQALQAHQVDAANIPADLLGATSRLPRFKRVQLGQTQAFDVIILNVANPAKPFMADVRFRQAVARAINQPRIIDVVYHGHGQPQHGLLPPSEAAYVPPDLRAGTGAGSMSYDPEAARKLLDEAGYKPGPDGIRQRNGMRLALTELESAGNDEGLLIDQLVASDLRRVGIEYDIKQLEFNQLFATMLGAPKGWDAVGLGYSGGAYPDGTQMFLSTSAQNFAHYKDKTMDRLVTAASTEPGLNALFAMERYIVEQQPMIFLGAGWPTLLVRPGLDNILAMVRPNATWSPEELRLSGPMACDSPHA